MDFEPPLEVSVRIEAFNQKIESNKGKVNVLLLGSGYPKEQLDLRKEIVSELKKRGYKVWIMELIPEWKITIGERFKDILDELKPDLFICILSKKGRPHGVIFEIGFLCGHFGRDKAIDNLRFCIENGLNKRAQLTIYVREVISMARTYDYYDKPDLIEVIEGIIKDYIIRTC